METRVCSKCSTEKPLTLEYFRKNQSTNTGGNKYYREEKDIGGGFCKSSD